ncbi:sugar ABC transporter substrate-binding protein [Ruania suaedae]|uniref:sugar ABC transporter substrate-binding protein n=1 Tax=Ruania suaedae TaxID=2897774 RepID=UPI001E597D29|nr:sugar ABC transporter substrate-binding protein [Ruania suaedae]UFU03715.1 sugar ABC transporter substrate-binding protein [Ruania suaedae]
MTYSTHTPWQRRAVLLASGGLAVSLGLAACGSGTGLGGSDEEASDGAAGEGEQTLTVWHYFSEPNQVEVMDTYAEMFEDAHPDVTVENAYVPYDQIMSKVVSATGAGEGPDVVVFNGAETSTLALADVLVPLDNYLADWEDTDQLPESVLHSVNDQIYGVQGYVNLLGLWYNQDILDEIGVEPPQTMDELEAAMQAAVEAGYEGITMTGLPQGQGEWQAYPWLSHDGFSYDSPDAGALESAFSRVSGWVESGYLSPEVVNWDQTVPFQEFAAGDIAFAENGNWQMGAAEDASFEYGVVPLPLDDSGQVYLGGEGQGITANADDPDLAWEYLTTTYLSVEGQVAATETVGYIPSRSDAAEDEAVTSDELLSAFTETVAAYGASYPAQSIPPESVPDVQLAVGQAWSAVLGGQQDPEEAASQVIADLEPLLAEQ